MSFIPSKKNDDDADEKIFLIKRAQEERKAQVLAATFNLPYVNLLRVPIEIDAISKVSEEKARAGLFLPFEIQETKIGIAVFNPEDSTFLEAKRDLKDKGFKVEVFVCSLSSLKRGLEEYKKVRKFKEKITEEIEVSSENVVRIEEKLTQFEELGDELKKSKNNTTFFIETIFASALKFNASDIHIIPIGEGAKIRYRIDGILHDITDVDSGFFNSLLSRIKLVSGLKINIHNIAQDGRLSINISGKEIEIRVSIVPGEHGEDIVMRILNPKMLLSIEDLGFHPWCKEILLSQMKKTIGMILTCGPTGSGKTTTLYACLKYIAKPEVKVLTIEDPIEYHLENIDQTQVDPERGYDFAQALRAAMRQDPDVILVGEIRDTETAMTAIQAAQTGHLVFSTLHTNDAAGIVPRLVEMGIDPPAIASALSLAISQRLIRRVCSHCKETEKVPEELLSKIQNSFQKIPKKLLPQFLFDESGKIKNFEIPKAKGCKECYNTGYKGRIGIYEMFKVTPKIEEAIISSPSIFEMREVIIKEGMVTMQQDALLRVIEGFTTIEELERVTGPLE